ncbi:MAG: septum formation initiator family protein [Caulobacterales bacterium]
MDIRSNWPVLAVGIGIVYFASNAVIGDQGLAKWADLQRRQERLQTELDAATQERALLDDRAAKLKAGRLDLDLVDERARELLGYARADEVILLPSGATGASSKSE